MKSILFTLLFSIFLYYSYGQMTALTPISDPTWPTTARNSVGTKCECPKANEVLTCVPKGVQCFEIPSNIGGSGRSELYKKMSLAYIFLIDVFPGLNQDSFLELFSEADRLSFQVEGGFAEIAAAEVQIETPIQFAEPPGFFEFQIDSEGKVQLPGNLTKKELELLKDGIKKEMRNK